MLTNVSHVSFTNRLEPGHLPWARNLDLKARLWVVR